MGIADWTLGTGDATGKRGKGNKGKRTDGRGSGHEGRHREQGMPWMVPEIRVNSYRDKWNVSVVGRGNHIEES